jgi:urease accessory protein UreE
MKNSESRGRRVRASTQGEVLVFLRVDELVYLRVDDHLTQEEEEEDGQRKRARDGSVGGLVG